jgi:acyl transferase domain-containing protein
VTVGAGAESSVGRDREPVAIIGMAARVPGAPSVGALWELLCREGNAIAEVPATRFAVDDFYDSAPAPQAG